MESTPPLTKKNTLRSAGDGANLFFDRADAILGIPILHAAADAEHEVRQDLVPLLRCAPPRDGIARPSAGASR